MFDAYLTQYGIDTVLQDEKIFRLREQANIQTPLFEKLGEYFLDGLWSRLNDVEKDTLGLFSVFRISLTGTSLMKLISDSKALQTLLNYSLIQRESREDKQRFSYQVLPVVRGYVESKLGPDKMLGYHLQAVEFYVNGHEDILLQMMKANNVTNVPRSEYPKHLALIADLATQHGQTQLAQTLATSLLEMHHHLFAAGEYEQALELERRTLQIEEEIKDKNGLAITHHRIAQLLFLMKRHDEALAAGEQALAKAQAIKYPQREAVCLHQLGLMLKELNRPQEAFARFQESLVITEKIGDRAGQADALGAMGQLLQHVGDLNSALICLHRAAEIVRDLGNPIKLAIALEDYGIIFERQGHVSEALEKYQEALRLKKQYGSPQGIAITENNIARVKGKMKGQ